MSQVLQFRGARAVRSLVVGAEGRCDEVVDLAEFRSTSLNAAAAEKRHPPPPPRPLPPKEVMDPVKFVHELTEDLRSKWPNLGRFIQSLVQARLENRLFAGDKYEELNFVRAGRFVSALQERLETWSKIMAKRGLTLKDASVQMVAIVEQELKKKNEEGVLRDVCSDDFRGTNFEDAFLGPASYHLVRGDRMADFLDSDVWTRMYAPLIAVVYRCVEDQIQTYRNTSKRRLG